MREHVKIIHVPMPAPPALTCPSCGEEIWDMPHGHKLAKCWNFHPETGGTLAFDTMPDDDQ